jgi:hypothetical protein
VSEILRHIRTVPVGNILVGDARSDVEHDDAALAVDVVTITETAKLLLTSGVPDIELDLTKVLITLEEDREEDVGRHTVVKPRG